MRQEWRALAIMFDYISITILERSFFFLFVRVENVLGSWILGMVYADPHRIVTEYIWDRILYYSQSSLSLCFIGDFNSIFQSCEKFRGSTK